MATIMWRGLRLGANHPLQLQCKAPRASAQSNLTVNFCQIIDLTEQACDDQFSRHQVPFVEVAKIFLLAPSPGHHFVLLCSHEVCNSRTVLTKFCSVSKF